LFAVAGIAERLSPLVELQIYLSIRSGTVAVRRFGNWCNLEQRLSFPGVDSPHPIAPPFNKLFVVCCGKGHFDHLETFIKFAMLESVKSTRRDLIPFMGDT
jgi:hypothetical protein